MAKRKLLNREEIIAALNAYRPDQADVIHQMARERGLDPARLTNYQYYILVKEEGEFSLAATDTEPDARKQAETYNRDMLALAKRIET